MRCQGNARKGGESQLVAKHENWTKQKFKGLEQVHNFNFVLTFTSEPRHEILYKTRQDTYNVTLGRVRVTIVTVDSNMC